MRRIFLGALALCFSAFIAHASAQGLIINPTSSTSVFLAGPAAASAAVQVPQTSSSVNQWVLTSAATSGTPTVLAGGASADAQYVINNSSVTTSSVVMCTEQGYSGTFVTNGLPTIADCVPGSGSITVDIINYHASNALSGAVKIGFLVVN